jgi:hypothetical protein
MWIRMVDIKETRNEGMETARMLFLRTVAG